MSRSEILSMYRKCLREADKSYTSVNGNKFFRSQIKPMFLNQNNSLVTAGLFVTTVSNVRKTEMIRKSREAERQLRGQTIERDAARVGFKLPQSPIN
eukprot:TRINITY_DN7164_c0_g1_i1.p1 TRINITY_DN7164_c0_g1~~TRINITY_DN7164_c0_g1_i1.p1  ORF type:complete len:112 (+),score=19.36 TRINITY_DN7164_c0_g1_i1:48-338(+)